MPLTRHWAQSHQKDGNVQTWGEEISKYNWIKLQEYQITVSFNQRIGHCDWKSSMLQVLRTLWTPWLHYKTIMGVMIDN
jgi:hypothetical protein